MTFLVQAVDITTGGRLQIMTLAGYNPITAGRFWGFGNLAYAVFATGALLATAAAVGPWVREGRKRAVLGAVGGAVTTERGSDCLRKGQPNQDVLAAARLLKLGKRLAVGEVNLLSGSSPDPIAHVTATYSIPTK